MLVDILTKELIWNSYFRYFLIPFEPFLPWAITFIISGFIMNKILNHLYYRLIPSGNPRNLAHNKCRVLCSNYDTKPFNGKS